jgi:hypothetical protein
MQFKCFIYEREIWYKFECISKNKAKLGKVRNAFLKLIMLYQPILPLFL